MGVDSTFIQWIDENICSLNRLRKDASLDGQINKMDFSIRLCNVAVKDDKTLDIEAVVKAARKDAEYASLEDYWVEVKPKLQSNINPGLKAKEAYELLYAVWLYD